MNAVVTNKSKGELVRIEDEVSAQLNKKYEFMQKTRSAAKIEAEQKKITAKRFDEAVLSMTRHFVGGADEGFATYFCGLLDIPPFLVFSVIFGFPMYLLILIFSNPYIKFVFERMLMMVFVIFGVTFLVFTILYMSPMDPAKNILGQNATPETVAEFNRVYGLDKPFLEQMTSVFKGIITFNVGSSFVGSEDVMAAIARRFPITLSLTFWSLLFAIALAIPAGIFSAIKPYSAFDYVFMLAALVGLSIPNFWLGLILILNFSINSKILPSLYIVDNWKSFIMPVIVLSTALSASVARMTRSSMLEVIKQDYVTTARAKGLPQSKVVIRHVLGNAMIPIVTVIGLQFGGLLGGAAVTEKVFNVIGLGSYIVDKQFIPDIPIVLAGTVYIAIIVSVTNLIVDILYAFLDPRIKSRMKNY
jgi:peptide/nickel transport system permease protein